VPTPPPRIVEAKFAYAATAPEQLPPPTIAEIAFAGRSNVGKSSLLNSLLERRNLVRIGATPGTTRQINFFLCRASDGLDLHLVDLPGYGYAKRSKHEKTAWGDLIESYLTSRPTLRALVLLVDVRRGVEPDDRELVEFMQAPAKTPRPPVPVVLVATKIDKVTSAARKPAVAKLGREVGLRAVGFSAHTGEGKDELWRVLRRAVVGTAAPTAI
jgi:GTP-binding protein